VKTPGFTAEAAFYKVSKYYGDSASHAEPLTTTKLQVRPASRRSVAYCSMKGCCIDLRELGFPRICCNGDECGPDVLI